MAELDIWRDVEAMVRQAAAGWAIGAAIGVALAIAGFIRRQRERASDLAGLTKVRALYGTGWRPEFETATHVFLVKGQPITHLLHLLLSVITFGVWLLVWLAIAMFGGQRRRTVTKS